MKIKRYWQSWFVQGPLRFIGKPLFLSAIALELAIDRSLDAIQRRRPNDHSLVSKKLTVIIKTFERPHTVKRLVISIKRHYPDLQIIVVDDSRQPIELEGAKTIGMPYNTGISAGRNEALKHVTTPYILLSDDDYIFYRNTNLDAPLLFLEQYPQIDMMGGEEISLPLLTRTDYRRGFYKQGNLLPTKAEPLYPFGTLIGGLPVRDKVPNFFIGRTDRVRLIGWDADLKLQEHRDFFTRTIGVLTTVSNHNLKCLHAREPFNAEYMKHRNDVASSVAALELKYSKNK